MSAAFAPQEYAVPSFDRSPIVVPVARIELPFSLWRWDYAERRRAEIEADFAARRKENPALWNGRTLLVRDAAVAGGVLSGSCFETDYASFLHWRDSGFPDPRAKNCFSMAALRASDGAFVLGLMAGHTANAGLAYFVAGMLEPSDLVQGAPDFAASLRRELYEETGLSADEVEEEPAWTAVFAGRRLGLAKLMQSRDDAEALAARIRRHIAGDAESELADAWIVRGPAELDARVPDHVVAFLDAIWDGRIAV